MNRAMNRAFVSLDLETTGFDSVKNNIIEIGAVRIENGVVVDELSELVNPGEEIPSIVTSITSITDEMVASAPTLEDLAARIQAFVQDAIIVGHNITFDIDFLAAAGLMDATVDRLDTWRISELVYPNAPSNSLEVLSSLIGLTHESAHRALDDAKAAYTLFETMQERLIALPAHDVRRASDALSVTDAMLSDYLVCCASIDPATRTNDAKTAAKPHWSDLAPIPEQDDYVDDALVAQLKTGFERGGQFVSESLHGTLLDQDLAEALAGGGSCVFVRPASALSAVSMMESQGTAMVLDEPYAYVSPSRCSAFIDGGITDPDDARLCALVVLWNASLEDGRMALLGIPVGPQTVSSRIALRAEDAEYQLLCDQAKKSAVTIVSHGSVVSPAIRPSLEGAHVVIESAMSLESAVERRVRHVISEGSMRAVAERLVSGGVVSESVVSSVSILFGLAGMAVREWRAWHDVVGAASFSWRELSCVSSYWRVELAARSVLDRLALVDRTKIRRSAAHEGIKKDLQLLHSSIEWLLSPPKKGIAQWWFDIERGTPVLYRQPALVRSLLVPVWDVAASVHAVDDTAFTQAPPSAAEPLAKRIGLSSVTVLQSNDTYVAPTALFPVDMPAFGEPGAMQRLHAYIERAAHDLGGSIVIVATSQTMVRDIYHALIETEVVTNGDVSVYAHQVTGGMGKSLSKYVEDASTRILILGSKAWTHQAMRALRGSVDTLILPKIPFTPLGDPLYQVKQEAFVGFESFSQLQLPDMVRSVRAVVRRMQPRQILLADTRAHTKSYGRQLMQSIGCGDPRSVTLSTDNVYNV